MADVCIITAMKQKLALSSASSHYKEKYLIMFSVEFSKTNWPVRKDKKIQEFKS